MLLLFSQIRIFSEVQLTLNVSSANAVNQINSGNLCVYLLYLLHSKQTKLPY